MPDSSESDIREYKEGSPYLKYVGDGQPLSLARGGAKGEDLGAAHIYLNRVCLHHNPSCLLMTSFMIS